MRRSLVRGRVLVRRFLERVRPPSSQAAFVPAPEVRQRLAEQVVVVTGSSRGLGLAVAEAFARAGSSVVLNGRDPEALERAREQVARLGAPVLAIRADVSTPEGAGALIGEALGVHGRIDALVNNAGVSGPQGSKIWETTPEDWNGVVGSSLTAAFLCAGELARWAQGARHPVRVLNVSSGIVGRGAPGLGVYGISKAGLEGLTQAIAADSAGGGGFVTCVSIRPRSVRTRLTQHYYDPTQYALLDDPEDVTGIFLYAATAPSAEIAGKSLSEPAFASDPRGEVVLNNAAAAVGLARPSPETFLPEVQARQGDRGGAYMHLMENPFGFYESLPGILSSRLRDRELYQYPDPSYPELRAALASQLALEPECIVLGSGSSELLDRTFRTFAGRPGEVVASKPTWGFARQLLVRHGLDLIEVPHRGSLAGKDYRIDLEGVLAALTPQTRLVYLVSPCNPTGALADRDQLRGFLSRVPPHVTVMLDEAYVEFAEPGLHCSLAEWLGELPCRAIGYRTFSKFFGLSGFRIGYAYSDPETIHFLERTEVPFGVTTPSQLAALAVMRDTQSQQRTYDNNHCERRRVGLELDRMGIENMPSQASFVLFNCPMDREKLREAAQKHGIFMPNVDGVFPENYAITSVGLPEHNARILEILGDR
jgi:histidinol-phosphate aminotransferase